jgi:hypothetical protein
MDAILTIKGLVGGGVFGSFWRCSQKGLAHLLGINYEVRKILVCDTLFRYGVMSVQCTSLIAPQVFDNLLVE